MLASQVPAKFQLPFGAAAGGGFITNPLPIPSQIAVTPGRASYTDGFPPLNMTPVASGGVPPFGQDMNGILYAVSAACQWLQAGGYPSYDAAFSTAVGGYPNGAMIRRADGNGFWVSTADNNTSNPDTGGANWNTVLFAGGSAGTIIAQGACKFSFSSTSTALLVPWNGASVFVNGAYSTIPAAGLPLAASLQTDNTDYNVYCYNYTSLISAVANNGSGLFRLTVGSTTNLATGYPLAVSGTSGASGLNGNWTVTVVDATHVDLQGSTFASGYTSGGSLLGPILQGSTTAWVTGANGTRVMTGDATKAWVGKFRLNGSGQFQQDATKWLIRSAFNDQGFAVSTSGATASVMFLPTELYCGNVLGNLQSNSGTGAARIQLQVDGGAVGSFYDMFANGASCQVVLTNAPSAPVIGTLAEGTHTFSGIATNGGGTSSITGVQARSVGRDV